MVQKDEGIWAQKLRERRLDRTDGIKSLENFEIIIKANNMKTFKKAIRKNV